MYEDKSVEKSLYSLLVNRNSMQSVASRMSLSVAKPAVTRAKMRLVARGSSLQQFVLLAVGKLESHLSRSLIVPFTAASALQG